MTALQNMLTESKAGWREVLLLAVSIGLTLVIGDLLLRSFLPPSYPKSRYGWQPREHDVRVSTMEDTTGQFREVTVRYFTHGFKRWGDPNSGKRKLFILGDSATEASQVSNGEEWYAYLEGHFSNVELFVSGVRGYGSLQEYLVLDDYIDTIKPNLILWQFCGNDYENNLYKLDLAGYPYNNHGLRPYLEQGVIVYRLPLPYAAVREYSFIADRLLKEYDRYVFDRAASDLAGFSRTRKAQETEGSLQMMKRWREEAHHVTREIMAKVKQRARGTPIYAFSCSDQSEDEEQIISASAGIIFLPGIHKYVNEQGAGRETRIPNDGHWNKLGNQLAGEKLVQLFERMEILK